MALSTAVRGAFERALAPGDVISDPVRCRAYECDGLTGYRVVPELVLLPRDAAQVAAAVRVCAEHGVPFVARGAGTGLSGGALPVADGVVISLARLKRVLEVDPVDRRAVVEPGVTNLEITAAAAPHGLYYAPDPSSQQVCTIGGNVAENSGGAHCLKYGFTTNHVLDVEVVLPDGSVVTLGAPTGEQAGPDLRGVFLGSEGTLGITTKITVRLLRTPETVRTLLADFPSIGTAGDVVSDIVAAGIVPAAVEMMDTLAIEAAEEAVHAGYTVGVPAALIVELDGPDRGVRHAVRPGQGDLRRGTAARGCTSPAPSTSARRSGRVARPRSPPSAGSPPTTSCRTAWCRAPGWPRSSAGSRRWARRPGCGWRTSSTPATGTCTRWCSTAPRRTRPSGPSTSREAIGRAVRGAGRVALGRARDRHGQGLLDAEDVRRGGPRDDGPGAPAFDPHGLCNPGKVLPTPRLCGERPGRYRPHPLEEAGVIERL